MLTSETEKERVALHTALEKRRPSAVFAKKKKRKKHVMTAMNSSFNVN